MIKYLFFDFDGTISDAHRLAFDCLARVLKENNYKFSRKKLYKLLGDKMQTILEKLNIPKKNTNKIRKEFYTYFEQGVLAGKIKLCVSVKPLYELSKKYPLIIISNSRTHFIRTSIKKLNLQNLFKKVYGAEKFTTKDELLERLFKKFKIKPSEAVYIGDRFSDIKYARKAGCIAVAIHNKCAWSSLEEIKKQKPDFIIKNFKELGKVLEIKAFSSS